MKTATLKRFLADRPKSRVVVETCAEAFRVGDGARAVGHEVRVVPATLVRQLGVGQHGIKTDQRDAQVLSEVSCRIDLPSVHIRSEQARHWKSLLGTRQGLIEARTQLINGVRGWLRTQILTVRRGGPTTFPQRVRDKLLDKPDGMPAFIERQLLVIEDINRQLKEADTEVIALVKDHPVCSRFMTVPGVGPLTAAQFHAAIDDVTRFRSAHDVESYLGLTPGERSSSLTKRRTGITKAGSPDVRLRAEPGMLVHFKTETPRPARCLGTPNRRAPRQVGGQRGDVSQARWHPLRDLARRHDLRREQGESTGVRHVGAQATGVTGSQEIEANRRLEVGGDRGGEDRTRSRGTDCGPTQRFQPMRHDREYLRSTHTFGAVTQAVPSTTLALDPRATPCFLL